MKAQILAKYGSREALERRVKNRRDNEAAMHLVDLRHFDEDPTRLDLEHTITTIATLTPRELEMLTGARLRLLQHLAGAERDLNVTALAASVGRDKKNVSQDLRILERLGLVRVLRSGREALPQPAGRSIHIILPGGAAES